MKTALAIVVMALLILPISHSFAQLTETPSTLGVKLSATQPFVTQDEDGYTVVIGEVENTRSFPVTNVKVWVGFYSSAASGPGGSTPLETTTGSTLLEVIPPYSKSAFIIKSQTPNPQITEVNLNMLGFNSAGTNQKQQLLTIKPVSATIGNKVTVLAEITNNGQQTSTGTKVHLLGLDAFNPPRILGIHTMELDPLDRGNTEEIEFDVRMDHRVKSFKLVAESDSYLSKAVDVTKVSLSSPTKLITINELDVLSMGEKTSEVQVGMPVNITSTLAIQFGALTSPKQDFVYYAQVKQFGEVAPVEFLGYVQGTFSTAAPQTVTVSWTPESEGAFFVEAYVWDTSGIALAAPSETISVILVKP